MQTNEQVALLTVAQKDELFGQHYAPDCFFNPIEDVDGNWIISTQEQSNCVNPEFQWVKWLPLIPYNPYIPPGPTGPTGV